MLRKYLSIVSIFCLISPVIKAEDASEATSVTALPAAHSHSVHGPKEFEWEMVLASEQIKDDETHNVSGQYTSLKNSFLYSVTPNDQVRLFNSFVAEDYKNNKYDRNYFEFAEFMYRRKSFLNEEEHFVNADFEIKQGYVVDAETRRYWGFNSETIPQLILKKRLYDGYGVEFKARHHFFHRNNKKVGTIAHEDRLYLSGYKMFGHQFLLNAELKYRHKIYGGKHYSWEKGGMMSKHYEETVLHPGLLYFLGRKAMVEGYVETKLNNSFDSRPVGRVMKDEFLIGAALYLSIL